MFNWLANSQQAQSQVDVVDDFEAPADDALSESDEDLGEFGHSALVADDDDDATAATKTTAATATASTATATATATDVNLSDESFLLRLYPALMESPTPSQATNLDEARGLLRSASKTDPMLAEKLVSEQKWLMQQFERQKQQQAAKRSSDNTRDAKKARPSTRRRS